MVTLTMECSCFLNPKLSQTYFSNPVPAFNTTLNSKP